MARPFKKGIDYFPMDCFVDDKLSFIQAEFGLKGFAVVVKLYQKIYGTEGYFCFWSDDIGLLFADENNVNCKLVSDIINRCIQRGIFDSRKFHEYKILTSAGIQKRYLQVVKRRKENFLKNDYLCITYEQIKDIVNNNTVNAGNNSINENNSQQSKVTIYNKEEKEGACAPVRTSKTESFVSYYMRKVNSVPSQIVVSCLLDYENKINYDCFTAVIDYCIDENKRNWSYINAVLNDKVLCGITTAELFYSDLASRTAKNNTTVKKQLPRSSSVKKEIKRNELI